jgi:hypothetical protein
MEKAFFFKRLSSWQMILIVLLAITALAVAIKSVIFNRYSLPPGNDDPMYIIIGKTFLEGKPIVAGYPPLVPLLFFLGGVTLTKIYGPLISSLLGLSSYLLIREITHNEYSAVIGCAIGATGSIFYAFEASLAWDNNAMFTSLVLGMILYWAFLKFNNADLRLRYLLLGLITSFLLGLVYILAFIFYFVILTNLITKIKRGFRFLVKGFLVFILPGLSSIPFILSSAEETVSNPLVVKNNILIPAAWIYFYNSFYTVNDLIFDSILITFAIIGVWIVYRFYKTGFNLLVLALLSPLGLALLFQFLGFTSFYSRFLELSLPPLLVLSSISIGHFSVLLLKKTRKKIISVLFVFFLITFTWGMMVQRLSVRVENDALIKQPELEAIQWLKDNTALDSTVAATYPIASWIEVLTGRRVVSGYHLLAALTTEDLLEMYRDVEIMQIANYFRQTGFFKVYDMSPISWTLSPMISEFSPENGEFMPVFWIDNGLSYINGKLLSESFKTYSLNDETYIVQGNDIEKKLEVNATDILISYNFTQSSGLKLTVFFDSQIASSPDDLIVSGQQVTTRYVPLSINFNNSSAISIYKDSTWNLLALNVTYESAKFVSISVHAKESGLIPKDTYTTLRQQLLTAYGIDYIVVFKPDPEGGWALSMLRQADKTVFENQGVAIFEVNSQ